MAYVENIETNLINTWLLICFLFACTGRPTALEKCNWRESETERIFCHYWSDIFTRWLDTQCQLQERCHQILSGSSQPLARSILNSVRPRLTQFPVLRTDLAAISRLIEPLFFSSSRFTSTRTSKIPDVFTSGFRTVASPLPAYFSSTITPQPIQSKSINRLHHFHQSNRRYNRSFSIRFCCSKSLWKYAITTSDNNTELKVWCCSTWECLQTITFKSPNVDAELFFQAEIDHRSSYLVMSDIKSRALYVLQIEKPNVQNSNTSTSSSAIASEMSLELDKKDNRNAPSAFIKSISEFPLSSPILSFGIVDAEVRRYKCNYNDNYLLDDMEEYDEETNSLVCVVIRMYLVQPKSVQECRVLYQPTVSIYTDVASTLSGSYKDATCDLTNENVLDNYNNGNSKPASENTIKVANITSPKSIKSETIQPSNSISLMTPDSFNSPGNIRFE